MLSVRFTHVRRQCSTTFRNEQIIPHITNRYTAAGTSPPILQKFLSPFTTGQAQARPDVLAAIVCSTGFLTITSHRIQIAVAVLLSVTFIVMLLFFGNYQNPNPSLRPPHPPTVCFGWSCGTQRILIEQTNAIRLVSLNTPHHTPPNPFVTTTITKGVRRNLTMLGGEVDFLL